MEKGENSKMIRDITGETNIRSCALVKLRPLLDRKLYKQLMVNFNRMFPSDPSGSLDDFIFNKFLFLGRYYGRNASFY